MNSHPKPTHQPAISKEQNVYRGVYQMLVAGMLISNLLFVIGLVLALLHPQYFPLTARWVRQQYHARLILHGLMHGQPSSFFLAGTALLILTPIARVLVSIYAFSVDHDRRYVAVTGAVLGIIVLTIILGIFGLH